MAIWFPEYIGFGTGYNKIDLVKIMRRQIRITFVKIVINWITNNQNDHEKSLWGIVMSHFRKSWIIFGWFWQNWLNFGPKIIWAFCQNSKTDSSDKIEPKISPEFRVISSNFTEGFQIRWSEINGNDAAFPISIRYFSTIWNKTLPRC